MACNHTSIEFNIFLISDFEQSLLERLKGIIPQNVSFTAALENDPVPPQSSTDQEREPQLPQDTAQALTTVTDAEKTDAEEAPVRAGEEPLDELHSHADSTGPGEGPTEAGHGEEDEPAVVAPPVTESVAPVAHDEARDERSADEVPDIPSTGISEKPADETDTHPQHTEQEKGSAEAEDPANQSIASSATLESSNHDEGERIENIQEVDNQDQDQDQTNDTEQGEEGEYYEEVYEEENEPKSDQTVDIDDSLPHTEAPVGHAQVLPEGSAPDALDGAAIEDAGDELEADVNEASISSSPLSDEDAFGEYDEDEPQGNSKLNDSSLAQSAWANPVSIRDSTKTPGAVPDYITLKGKRSLGEIDQQDTDEYDDEDYGVDAKRARLE